MTLTNAEIKKIAYLARLQITDHELNDYTSRLTRILDLIDQMQQVGTDGLEPLSNPLNQCQRLRPDQVTTSDQRDAFMCLAPDSSAGLYLVPRVIE